VEPRGTPAAAQEVAVKKALASALVSLVVLAALGPAVSAGPLPSGQKDPEALIRAAVQVTGAPHFSREEITAALAGSLEAALLILPPTGAAADAAPLLQGVHKALREGVLFEDRIRQDLASAFKMLSGGKDWGIPKELTDESEAKKGIEAARKIGLELLESALAEWRAGRAVPAAQRLVSFVLLVVTPIKAPGRA
jgi:hypothetical protein